jgi:hypothetical protein
MFNNARASSDEFSHARHRHLRESVTRLHRTMHNADYFQFVHLPDFFDVTIVFRNPGKRNAQLQHARDWRKLDKKNYKLVGSPMHSDLIRLQFVFTFSVFLRLVVWCPHDHTNTGRRALLPSISRNRHNQIFNEELI